MKYKRVNKPKKLRIKEGIYGGHTTSLHDAIPYMMDACKGKGGCAFDCRHFVYDTLDGVLEPDADPRYFLRPESVTAFLQKNESEQMIYVTTDHKPCSQEIDDILAKVKSEE